MDLTFRSLEYQLPEPRSRLTDNSPFRGFPTPKNDNNKPAVKKEPNF